MKILITGANGQIGRNLIRTIPKHHILLAADRTVLDITRRTAVFRTVAAFRPDIIINAAAYTAVDQAESEAETATAVNEYGAMNLAQAAAENGAAMLHLSTDYVFDGKANTPYRETDIPRPQNIYGMSKLAGEAAVQAACPRSIILRTSWVFSEYGNHFVNKLLQSALHHNTLDMVADQYGTPTYAGDIAAALIHIAETIHNDSTTDYGIYHFSGSPCTSRLSFAQAILKSAYQQGILTHIPALNPVSSTHYPTAAYRPLYSCLDNTKIQAAFNISPRDWKKSLSLKINRIFKNIK